jgi:hypothetical protein
MDFNKTLDIIIRDLREAREIIDDLKTYPGVPVLQVELAKSKCRNAEEIIALLKTIKQDSKDQQAVKEKKVESVEKAERIEEVPLADTTEHTNQMDLFELAPEDEEKPESSLSELNYKKDKKDIPERKTIFGDTDSNASAKSTDEISESNIVADKFTAASATIYEQIGGSIESDEDASSDHIQIPITDLNDAIGINDKFLFIREIFGGNQSPYNEAIAKLNKSNDLEDARAVILSYTGEIQESEAIVQLLDLVKRKLASDG